MVYVILHYVELRRGKSNGAEGFEHVFSRILLHTVRAGSHPVYKRQYQCSNGQVYVENSPVVCHMARAIGHQK